MAKLSSTELNTINLKMRQSAPYQAWFRAQGLNPNSVTLNDDQRAALTQVLAQNGMALPQGALLDKSGNIGNHHGWAGLPTWAKIATGAAPIAAAMLIPGVREATLGNLGSLFGVGGTAAAPTAAAGTTLGTAGTTAAVGGGGAFTLGNIMRYGVPAGLQTATNIYGARTQANAANDAARYQTEAANHAADVQAQAAKDALEFQKTTEATRKAEFDRTEAENLRRFTEAQGRLTPYRNMGLGALMQLRRPIGA